MIRDNRKIDRDAKAADGQNPSAASGPDAPDDLLAGNTEDLVVEQVPMVAAVLLDERTADLQRLQAEYANYRKRADRDRSLAGDAAVARVLGELVPVLDDLDRARTHDDLTGPLKAVADKLDAVVGKLGLVAFGEVGDPFDPAVHEAVLHDESDAVTVPTCTTVMRPGFKHHDRLIRPAMVGVTDPTNPAEASDPTAASDHKAGGDPSESQAHPPENEVRDGHPAEADPT